LQWLDAHVDVKREGFDYRDVVLVLHVGSISRTTASCRSKRTLACGLASIGLRHGRPCHQRRRHSR